jgi:hypothetical protein
MLQALSNFCNAHCCQQVHSGSSSTEAPHKPAAALSSFSCASVPDLFAAAAAVCPQDCKVGSKTITKKFCEKKCKPSLELQLPAVKLPKLPTTVPPANPNPSAPPAAANPSAPPAALAQADAPEDDSSSSSSALSALTGLLADKLPHADLDVACRDVCVEVPIVLPELECSESSKVVEKCTFVPEKTCKEECICLPQKSLSLNLPKKPTLSVSASIDSKVVG